MTSVAERMLIDRSAVDELEASFGGELVRPGDGGYDEHRKVWNGSIDRRPGLIARCTGVADVRHAVRFAREHDSWSPCAGAAIASRVSRCATTDADRPRADEGHPRRSRGGTVRAQAGVLLGELDRETQAFGLAVPAGTSPTPDCRASRSAVASGGSCASTGSRSTSCSRST